MNAQTLDFPPIVQEANQPLAKLTIKETVLAQFREAETALKGLAEKYRDVAFDVTTTKGMDAAKAARLELRESGRFMVQRAEAKLKVEVNDLKRVVADEAERLVAIVRPHEDAIHAQIEAEIDRKNAEKAIKAQGEAFRVALHVALIERIRVYVHQAQGLPSERIAKGLALVEAMTFGEECQDHLPLYKATHAETLASLRTLLADAQAREEAEARRLENERIAAELAAQRKALEDQAAELKRQTEAAHAARVAITHAAVFTFPEPEPVKTTEAQPPQQVLKAEPAMAEATDRGVVAIASPSVGSMGAGQASDEAPAGDTAPVVVAEWTDAVVEVAEPTLITTDQLGKALGLQVPAALIESLGFTAIKLKKPGAYWDQAKVKEIGEALIAYVAKNIEGL
jgi:hypothetical protein